MGDSVLTQMSGVRKNRKQCLAPQPLSTSQMNDCVGPAVHFGNLS